MNPYLSIVMGIGGDITADLEARLCTSMAVIVNLAEMHELPCEIVLVLWNAKSWRFRSAPRRMSHVVSIRQIDTGDMHDRVPNPHGFRYFEWYPKNTGIRRARGQFVLSTNPDDIFPSEMFEFFSRQELESGHFYRALRHDMRDGKVFAVLHPTGPKPPGASLEEIKKNLPRACPWSENMLAYNAAGDFTLMAKSDWLALRGNPEMPYNDSVDGQTLWLAHTFGMKQIVLPYPIYHPDHPRTLNLAYVPGWDDNAPHATQNTSGWGFAGVDFPETEL